MDLGMKGLLDFTGAAGEVDHHAVGIDVADREAVRLEPARDGIDVLLAHAVLLSLFRCGQPLAEVGRRFVGEGLDVLGELFFQVGGALQLKERNVEGEFVGDAAAIISGIGFKAGIADEGDQPVFIDWRRNEGVGSLGRAEND